MCVHVRGEQGDRSSVQRAHVRAACARVSERVKGGGEKDWHMSGRNKQHDRRERERSGRKESAREEWEKKEKERERARALSYQHPQTLPSSERVAAHPGFSL